MSTANTHQVGGAHYNTGDRPQHWDYVVRALKNRYLEGQITKYIARHRLKNGRQDVEKAIHYLDKLVEEFRAGRVAPMFNGSLALDFNITSFCVALGFEHWRPEFQIMQALSRWRDEVDLADVSHHLQRLLSSYAPAEEAGPGYVQQG